MSGSRTDLDQCPEAITRSVGGIDDLASAVGSAAQSHGSAVAELVQRLGAAGERTEAQAASSQEAAAAAEETAATAEEVAATAHLLSSKIPRTGSLVEVGGIAPFDTRSALLRMLCGRTLWCGNVIGD